MQLVMASRDGAQTPLIPTGALSVRRPAWYLGARFCLGLQLLGAGSPRQEAHRWALGGMEGDLGIGPGLGLAGLGPALRLARGRERSVWG